MEKVYSDTIEGSCSLLGGAEVQLGGPAHFLIRILTA